MRVVILRFIDFNGAVHWSLCWRGLGITLSGLAFVTPPISITTPWFTPSKISIHHWVGPCKSVSNRAPHLLTPSLVLTVDFLSADKIHHHQWNFAKNTMKSKQNLVISFNRKINLNRSLCLILGSHLRRKNSCTLTFPCCLRFVQFSEVSSWPDIGVRL